MKKKKNPYFPNPSTHKPYIKPQIVTNLTTHVSED